MACALTEGIGTVPNFYFLGATYQIQGYTLHLAVLATLSFLGLMAVLGYFATGRLTRPYPGRLVHLLAYPSSASNHCQVALSSIFLSSLRDCSKRNQCSRDVDPMEAVIHEFAVG